MAELFRSLRAAGKQIFIATNSHLDYGNAILEATLGPEWSELIDFLGYFTCKPHFFTHGTPFFEADPLVPDNRGPAADETELKAHTRYLFGNYQDMEKFFEARLGKERGSLQILWFGD